MEDLKIIEKHFEKNYFSILIHDMKEDIKIWIDCDLMDGYGNKDNFKTEDLYINWEFNQYIFFLNDENDLKIKDYQENIDNIEKIDYFIDENNNNLINEFIKESEVM